MSKHTPGPWEDMTKLKRLEQAVDQLTDSATHLFDVVAEIVQANAAINAELLAALEHCANLRRWQVGQGEVRRGRVNHRAGV